MDQHTGADPDGYIGLVSLSDYFGFLKDEDGELNAAMFKSNVRGYQGLTSVNNAMANALESGGPLNFWLLNNGITIISSGRVQSVAVNEINIEDPQIVNGLQTSRKIFDYMTKGDGKDERAVLVKVLPVADAEQRRLIIRATNNQNPMNAAALLATDDVHYQIEELFKSQGLYYDRRPGFYRDQGCPAASIISVTELVQAVAALLDGRPDTARARPSDYINKKTEYNKIFASDRTPLGSYYKCITILRLIEEFLRGHRIDKGVQRNFKYHMAYVVGVRLTGKVFFGPDDLMEINNALMTDELLGDVFLAINRRFSDFIGGETSDQVAKGPKLLAVLLMDLSETFDVSPRPKRSARKMKPRDVIKQLETL